MLKTKDIKIFIDGDLKTSVKTLILKFEADSIFPIAEVTDHTNKTTYCLLEKQVNSSIYLKSITQESITS